METFCIGVHGATLRFISDVPLQEYFSHNKQFMEFYDPIFIQDNPNIEHTFTYVNSSENPGLVCNENSMVLRFPYERLTPNNILYLGYMLLEKQFGILGLSSCHSACVCKNGEATLIIGEAGAGKTSLAVNLCQYYGFSLISNDMTLIGLSHDGLAAYGGTKFLNLRLLSVRNNMDFLLYLFDNDKQDEWSNKVTVMAQDIGLPTEYGVMPIVNIINVRMDNREKSLKVSEGDSWRNNFLLYQNLSSHIRGQAAGFVDNKGHPVGFVPSFETEQSYLKRQEIINLINTNESYYYANGSLNDLLAFIDSLYNGKEKGQARYISRKKEV